jgi:Zn-dependent M28 family amino/carboxypeptidase
MNPPIKCSIGHLSFAFCQCGLLGSQAIAATYEAAGKEIKGMIQFDMTVCSSLVVSYVLN